MTDSRTDIPQLLREHDAADETRLLGPMWLRIAILALIVGGAVFHLSQGNVVMGLVMGVLSVFMAAKVRD